jgi:hypothetical protein
MLSREEKSLPSLRISVSARMLEKILVELLLCSALPSVSAFLVFHSFIFRKDIVSCTVHGLSLDCFRDNPWSGPWKWGWIYVFVPCVGTPTWQHIFFLCLVPRLLSQQRPLYLTPVSTLRSKTNYRFPSQKSALSLPLYLSPIALSILTALAKRPSLVPQRAGLIQQTTPTKSANWPMAEQADQQRSKGPCGH